MATSWRVTADLPGQFDFDAAGNPIAGHQVSFVTGTGATGTVFVPEAHYSPASVRALINAKAATADQIASLTSGS
jgi:hypothetical protein